MTDDPDNTICASCRQPLDLSDKQLLERYRTAIVRSHDLALSLDAARSSLARVTANLAFEKQVRDALAKDIGTLAAKIRRERIINFCLLAWALASSAMLLILR
jgi:hypothetical protein